MARQPVSGNWTRLNSNRSFIAGAAKWGTGVNPIHEVYGSDALRFYGRREEGMEPVQQPRGATADYVSTLYAYGYQLEDINGLDVFQLDTPQENWAGIAFIQDGWPEVGKGTPQTRADASARSIYPIGSPGIVAHAVRVLRYGPRDADSEVSNEVPTETVSEGWTNKNRGALADAEPSDPAQYERQTSMQQRYRTRVNDHAVARHTDDPRSGIDSRVGGQKLKTYSGEEPGSNRHEDMFPYQQDDIIRPFWNRTAGTGYYQNMRPNAMYVSPSYQRTPPPDAGLGEPDVMLDQQDPFGFTGEDQLYY